MKKLLFLMLILIFGCNHSTKEIKINPELKYADNLKKKCIYEGNKTAYGELIDYYGNYPSEYYELLPISIIMADKYNNDQARVAIYFEFIEMENNGSRDEKLFFKLEQSKKNLIIKYLMDGAKNNSPGCKEILKRIQKGGVKIENHSN